MRAAAARPRRPDCCQPKSGVATPESPPCGPMKAKLRAGSKDRRGAQPPHTAGGNTPQGGKQHTTRGEQHQGKPTRQQARTGRSACGSGRALLAHFKDKFNIVTGPRRQSGRCATSSPSPRACPRARASGCFRPSSSFCSTSSPTRSRTRWSSALEGPAGPVPGRDAVVKQERNAGIRCHLARAFARALARMRRARGARSQRIAYYCPSVERGAF